MKLNTLVVPDTCGPVLDLQLPGWNANQITEDTEAELATFIDGMKQPRFVLDLGCGVGRVTAGLSQVFPDAHYVLADRTKISPDLRYGWNPGDEWYNDLSLTKEFVEANGVRKFDIFDICDGEWDSLPVFDLVVSMKSVGYHYPVEPYLPMILRHTRIGSTIALGVRVGRYAGGLGVHFESTLFDVLGGAVKNRECLLISKRLLAND